jgi:hypothetical protein
MTPRAVWPILKLLKISTNLQESCYVVQPIDKRPEFEKNAKGLRS